ncbi:hypothetical protein PTI98_011588 [Pleurotus ostreatus]|nr:hypothetical protein PTI98_011588 [Pleurotus ostreatus]
MSADTYTFSGALTLKLGDTKGVLTIHRLNSNLEIFRKKAVGRSRQLIAIRALTWNPQHPNELYVGFANGDLISYRLRLDVDATDYEDPSSFLAFEGPIHDLVIAPSGAELFVVFGTSVAVVREGTRAHLTVPLESRPTRLILDMNVIIVIFMVAEPGVSPAAIAYDLHSHEVRWRLFTSCHDMILSGAISHDHRHPKITILHATKGAETYTLPNLDHVSTVFPGRSFPSVVDIAYVDHDTFVCGSSIGGLLFANVISGQTSEISATVRATYMLTRLDVARLRGSHTRVVTIDGNLLSPFCDVLDFTETVLPRSRSRSNWTYSALALLAAMSIIYFQASEGGAIAMSSLSAAIGDLSSTVFGSPEPPTLSPSALSSPELPFPESPPEPSPSAPAELEASGSASSDALSSSPIISPDPPSSSVLDLPPPNSPAPEPSSQVQDSPSPSASAEFEDAGSASPDPLSSSPIISPESITLDLPPPNSPASAPEPSSQLQGSPMSIRSSDYQPREPGPPPSHETESELDSSPPSGSDSGTGLSAPALDNPEYTQLPLVPSADQHSGQASPPRARSVPPDHAGNPVTIATLAPAATVTITRDVQIDKASVGSVGGLVFGVILGITVTLVSMAFVYNSAAVRDWFAGDLSTTLKEPTQPMSSTSTSKPTPSTSTTSAEVKDE